MTVPTGITSNGATSNLTNGGAGAQFAINGQRTRANNFLLDGTDNNDISITGPAATFRELDAFAEFSVQTGLFSAEFGRAGGGVLNLITKSGTNQFHGTARWLFRSNALNALTNEERVAGLTKPAVFTNNIFGGTFGGPIRKDKTFFFGSVTLRPLSRHEQFTGVCHPHRGWKGPIAAAVSQRQKSSRRSVPRRLGRAWMD